MNVLMKLSAAVTLGALAACQHTAPVQQPPGAVDPAPPVLQQQGQGGSNAASAPQQAVQGQPGPTRQQPPAAGQPPAASTGARNAAPAGQQQVVITLHLAQQNKEDNLIPIDAGGAEPLYALPQPVLTQADMHRVTPVRTQDQGNFVLFEMNEAGSRKLRLITERARGHFLLLSVQGQLASVVRIGDVIDDGRLLVGTQGPEHSDAILRLMRGG